MGGAAAAFDVGGFPHTSYPERKPSAFCVWLGWGAAELRVLLGESQAKLWRSLGAAGAVGPMCSGGGRQLGATLQHPGQYVSSPPGPSG